MPIIQVYGPGCPRCQTLHELAQQAARELDLDCVVEKVSDLNAILALGILSTPALVVDGTVRVSGRVPTLAQVKEMLS